MTRPVHTPLERVRVFTPLGIRFWDPVLGVPVADGLQVTAHPADAPSISSAKARRTATGVYAFHRLPGLHEVAYPVGDTEAGASPPAERTFVVLVEDEQERFLSAAFSVELPLPARGVYPLSPAGPTDEAVPGFFLFSAPTRSLPAGTAAVDVQLQDAATGAAAAFAVVAVDVDGATWYGLADERGQATVRFPYPSIPTALSGSPPRGAAPLAEQTWLVTVRVLYEPAARAELPGTSLPALPSMFDQGGAVLYIDPPGSPGASPVSQRSETLRFGRRLVLRTTGTSELIVEG